MNPLGTQPKKSPGKRLRELFDRLPEAEQKTVLDFVEFLAVRTQDEPRDIPEPEPIPRPEGESVIKAMRRLSSTYHMLDKSKMLNETSALMAQHVMQGRAADEVIDELEIVFETHYKRLVGDEE